MSEGNDNGVDENAQMRSVKIHPRVVSNQVPGGPTPAGGMIRCYAGYTIAFEGEDEPFLLLADASSPIATFSAVAKADPQTVQQTLDDGLAARAHNAAVALDAMMTDNDDPPPSGLRFFVLDRGDVGGLGVFEASDLPEPSVDEANQEQELAQSLLVLAGLFWPAWDAHFEANIPDLHESVERVRAMISPEASP